MALSELRSKESNKAVSELVTKATATGVAKGTIQNCFLLTKQLLAV